MNSKSRYSNEIYCTLYSNTHNNYVTVNCAALAADAKADLLVLVPYNIIGTIDFIDNVGLSFGDSRSLNQGDICYVIGNPLNFDVLSISSGIIRDEKFIFSNGVESVLISAPTHSGNSGGPIVDIYGNVISILSHGITGTDSLSGGCSQFMMEPILNYLIDSTDVTSINLQQISNINTYELQKSHFDIQYEILTTSHILSKSVTLMVDIDRNYHGGVIFKSQPSNTNSKFQLDDILLSIRYQPILSYDPNFIEDPLDTSISLYVTIEINQWNGYSPTCATWFINRDNIDTVSVNIIRSNNLITLSNLIWNQDLKYMDEINDYPLTNNLKN